MTKSHIECLRVIERMQGKTQVPVMPHEVCEVMKVRKTTAKELLVAGVEVGALELVRVEQYRLTDFGREILSA